MPLATLLPRWSELFAALADGTITDIDFSELAQLLADDTTALTAYVRYVDLHVCLPRQLVSGSEVDLANDDAAARGRQSELPTPAFAFPLPLSKNPVLGFLARGTVGRRRPVIWSILAVAIVFYGAFASLSWNLRSGKLPSGNEFTESAVAFVSETTEVRWSPHSKAKADNAPIRLDEQLTIDSGLVNLTLSSGVKLMVEGPAQWSINGDNSTTIQSGKLVAKVPPQAIGFRVSTPTAQIVDLGTEFSVDVSNSGATEVQVIRGAVEVGEPKSSLDETKSQAVRVSAGQFVQANSNGLSKVTVANSVQSKNRANYLDLVDIVAGGNGRGLQREKGIDAATGRIVYRPDSDYSLFSYIQSTGYRRLEDRPLIDGVAIPDPSKGPVQLDSAGHTFANFPQADGTAYGPIWAGGSVPERSPIKCRTTFDGKLDYAVAPHGLIAIFPNKLITFDLEAIRREHPGVLISLFHVTVGVTTPDDGKSYSKLADTWIFVDGELRHSRPAIDESDGPQDVEIQLSPAARFLTLVATDGGNTPSFDWVVFGDPRLAVETSDNKQTSKSTSTNK